MHKGIVIKFNTNQRYATNAWTTSVLREIASRVDVPLQVKICFYLKQFVKIEIFAGVDCIIPCDRDKIVISCLHVSEGLRSRVGPPPPPPKIFSPPPDFFFFF